MKDFQHYTLGFVVFKNTKTILLIEKLKPEFQKGYLNGLGGKMEEAQIQTAVKGETITECIIREVAEESGLLTSPSEWNYFCSMRCTKNSTDKETKAWIVDCFINIIEDSNRMHEIINKEEEKLALLQLDQINTLNHKLLGNISWLVGMGIDFAYNRAFSPVVIYYNGLSLPIKL